MCRAEYAEAVDKAVFPGLQGGPHNHATAAIAVALKEAASGEFGEYAARVVSNAKILADALSARGFDLVSGGTDNHLLLIDVTNKGITGHQMARALDAAGIVCNRNLVPGDPRPARRPSGIRIGTPAITSRGFGDGEMLQLADWMQQVAAARADGALDLEARRGFYREIAGQVKELCDRFPAPGLDYPAGGLENDRGRPDKCAHSPKQGAR